MPPKVRITKEEIIQEALSLVRERGAEAINARELAGRLKCSTQPIFSNFASMEHLQDAVLAAAYDCYMAFQTKEVDRGQYPMYKAYGMAYIRFAMEERELFKLLFMCDRTGKDTSPSLDFEAAVRMLMESNGISYEKATRIHLENWICVHGIGVMIATSFLKLDWDLISEMMSDIYHGLRLRHFSKEEKE